MTDRLAQEFALIRDALRLDEQVRGGNAGPLGEGAGKRLAEWTAGKRTVKEAA